MSNEINKKMVPKLRFSEFMEEEGWEEKSLEEACEVNPVIEKLPESFVYIDLESVEDGVLLQKRIIKLSNAPSRAQRLLRNGDIIFQTVRPYQKNNLFFKTNDNLQYVASTGYAQLRAFESEMYLFQYLYNQQFIDRVLAKCTGSNYPAINSGALSEISVVIPSLPQEQQKVAACLSSLDKLITAQSQKLEALKAYKKGLMQQLFPAEGETVPKLRFAEFRDSGEWEVDIFDSLVDIIDGDRGINYPKSEDFYSSGYCVFLNAKNVTKNGFVFKEVQFISKESDEILRKGKLRRLDIVLTTRGSVGQFAFYTEKVDYNQMRINSGMVILRVKSNFISSRYLYEFCKSENITSVIKKLAFGNAQLQLTVAVIKNLPLLYPKEKSEQQKIAACLSSLDELIAEQEEKIETLKTHKKGLMQQLFPNTQDISE